MSASSTARRIAATVLAAGAMVSIVALPASAHEGDRHRTPKAEISAVQADSPGRDNRTVRSLNAEWVEITNNTRHAINLAHSGRRGTGMSSSDTAEACGRGLVMIGRPRTASALRGHGRGGQPERIW
ncbi:hypothetical protein [Streptomyces flavochromogenes]|uniref:hypothetical protein n=1 Tax=Streptomyces flavochromogenes TaxID=68199 RepID=UPI000ACCE8CE